MWTVTRTQGTGSGRSGWATPHIWQNDLRTEIVTIGQRHAISYDLDGKELWRLGGIHSGHAVARVATRPADCGKWLTG